MRSSLAPPPKARTWGNGMTRRGGTAAVLLFMVVCVYPAAAQQSSSTGGEPLIILTKLASPTGDPVAEQIAATITASLDLTMGLTGTVRVQRADFLLPTSALDRAVEYYRQAGAAGAVFGSVSSTKNGGYEIDLEIWNGEKEAAKTSAMRQTVTNALAIFDIADALSLQVASTIVGHKLSEGKLVVANTRFLPSYAVYADGKLLGRNRSQFRVLTGSREIVVAKPGPIGDLPVESFHVDIRAGRTTTVTLQKKRPPANEPVGPAAPIATRSAGSAEHLGMGEIAIQVKRLVAGTNAVRIALSGPKETRNLLLRGDQSISLALGPGKYAVQAAFTDDTSPGYEGQVQVMAGVTSRLLVPLGYSPQHQIAQLEGKRTKLEGAVAATRERRSRSLRRGLILEGLGAVAGGAAGLFYYLTGSAYSSYQSATTTYDATRLHTVVTADRMFFFMSAAGGTGLITWGTVAMIAAPSDARLQRSINLLDSQISALRAKETVSP